MPDTDPPVVLLLTHHRDVFTVDRVAAALEARGARPLRVDTDLFPGELMLTAVDHGDGMRYLVDDGRTVVDDRQVTAVWTRSFWPPVVAEELDREYREPCLKQSRAALEGFLDGLDRARWINDPHRLFQAGGNKVRQLRLARACGLAIPATLVTNDPRRVRQFYERVDGRMVTKLLIALSMSMDGSGAFLPTTEVAADDLDHLDSLRFGPMIFQERIDKAIELRVLYVAGRCFTGAIDTRAAAAGRVDWRQARTGEAAWQEGSLPAAAKERLGRLMRGLGLEYGAVDMIRTPAGEHVFLEVNPLGEWGMLERDLDLPISEAIADALVATS